MKKLEGKVILVTGAHGFIGAHLASRLAKITGVKILLLSRQARQSNQENVVCIRAELRQLSYAYWQSIGINNIDYVFHLGAFTPKTTSDADNVGRSIDDNILGTHALLQSLPNNPAKLIFSSTLDVYLPSASGEVVSELSKVGPSSLYGASKLFCEQLVSAWAKERSCSYGILRYGHIYGPGEEQYEKLIPKVISNLMANQAPVVYGDGGALRDYLYVEDAVEATVRAALIEENLEPLNIVCGASVTLKEIVQHLIRLVGSNQSINFLLDKPNGNSLRFDNGRMKQLLGNWVMVDLEAGLEAEVIRFRRIENER
jgi:UDP-glucose 4-epimerase